MKVLWIDDQKWGIRPFVVCLKAEGHEVDVLTTASAGLNRIQERGDDYCVFVLDVMLSPGERLDLFPKETTDDGLSSGALLIDYVAHGVEGEAPGRPDVLSRFVIFSGASIDKIVSKIHKREHTYSIPYRLKGTSSDPTEFVAFLEELVEARRKKS